MKSNIECVNAIGAVVGLNGGAAFSFRLSSNSMWRGREARSYAKAAWCYHKVVQEARKMRGGVCEG